MGIATVDSENIFCRGSVVVLLFLFLAFESRISAYNNLSTRFRLSAGSLDFLAPLAVYIIERRVPDWVSMFSGLHDNVAAQ